MMINTDLFKFGLFYAMWYLPIFVICVFVIWACSSGSTNDEQLLVEYRESGGMDMYTDGDSYGRAMKIYTSGYMAVTELIYTVVEGETTIEEVSRSTHWFKEEKIEAVSAEIEKSNFNTFPSCLPDASPHEINVRTPAPSVRIASEVVAPNGIKTVNAHMGAVHKHYPDGFLELLGYLRTLLDELAE